MLRVAIQKSGRLNPKSLSILSKCGFDMEDNAGRVRHVFEDFPLEVWLLRDDDIPSFVHQGACDLGIVGWNEVEEYCATLSSATTSAFERQCSLGFGRCRLSLAVPEEEQATDLSWFEGKKIATSYPAYLKKFLAEKNIAAELYRISGSVEGAPGMGVAHGICDLVATGTALQRHRLKEVHKLFDSEAVLISSSQNLSTKKKQLMRQFVQRVEGTLKAESSRYIMMNAPLSILDTLLKLIPGLEHPSIMPLYHPGSTSLASQTHHSQNPDTLVAIHVVAQEPVFWSTIEALKEKGAHSILVLPIEKMVD